MKVVPWSDDLTRGLIESQIADLRRLLKATPRGAKREKLQERLNSLKQFHKDLYQKRKPKRLSKARLVALLETALRDVRDGK